MEILILALHAPFKSIWKFSDKNKLKRYNSFWFPRSMHDRELLYTLPNDPANISTD